MIPKKIHFCWLSSEPFPKLVAECINSWQEHMPEYELVLWDQKKFNTNSITFVREACERQKWAFASDYIRAYAVYREGGIYLDSDVLLRGSLDKYSQYNFFSAIEFHPKEFKSHKTNKLLTPDGRSLTKYTKKPGIGMQSAIFGANAGHPFLKSVMQWYENRNFIDGKNEASLPLLSPSVFGMIGEDFGFRYKNSTQTTNEGMLFVDSSIIAGNAQQALSCTIAIHLCAGSWRPQSLAKRALNVFRWR